MRAPVARALVAQALVASALVALLAAPGLAAGIGPTPDPLLDLQAVVPGDVFGRRVALTFDDGPHPVYTPRVLDALARRGVKGTFFVLGRLAAEHPALIRRIVAEGHELGNHSWDHAHLPTLGRAAIVKQLADTEAAVSAALGRPYPLRLVRAPFGAENDMVRRVVAERGGQLVLWNAHARNVFLGPEGHPPVLYPRGGPILFHDTAPDDWSLIDAMVTRLRADGIEVVTAGALVAQKYASAARPRAPKLQAAASTSRQKARRPRR